MAHHDAPPRRHASPRAAPGPPRGPMPGPGARSGMAIGLAAGAFLVTALIGTAINAEDGFRRLLLGTAVPLSGWWDLRVGWPTPVAVAVAATVLVALPRAAQRLTWRRLLVACWVAGMAWAFTLAQIGGDWLDGPNGPKDYLVELPRVGADFLPTFTDHVLLSSPGFHWETHVAGHPPGALLTYWAIARAGLEGNTWASVLCVISGASAAAAALIVFRALAGDAAARRAAPFVCTAPAVVWIASSTDALFTGITAWSTAALAVAAGRRDRRGDLLAALGGAGLGVLPYLSFGYPLLFPLAGVAVLARRRLRPLLVAAIPAAAVVVGFTAAGYWWWDGLVILRERYYEGYAATRPFELFVVANLAVFAVVLGPAGVGALARIRRVTTMTILPITAGATILVADLSAMSKSEVERIWLPWTPWLLLATALLPDRGRRWWLGAQLGLALAVQSFIRTSW